MAHQAPLSLNQEFLCLYDRGDDEGPFGPRYHIVHGWRIRGEVDVESLQGALDDVVARHEALRTTVVRTPEDRHQAIRPVRSAVQLILRDLPAVAERDRDAATERLLIEVEADTFPSTALPLLRAVLARFDDRDAVLVLISHHTATDGWSMRLIIRDLANRYAARRGHDVPALPPPRQYREFAHWQRELVADPDRMAEPAQFWPENLRSARVFTVDLDRPRSTATATTTAMHRFLIGADVIARRSGSAGPPAAHRSWCSSPPSRCSPSGSAVRRTWSYRPSPRVGVTRSSRTPSGRSSTSCRSASTWRSAAVSGRGGGDPERVRRGVLTRRTADPGARAGADAAGDRRRPGALRVPGLLVSVPAGPGADR
ncbi:condensation domain-containing protein [Micromonospora sp. M12]